MDKSQTTRNTTFQRLRISARMSWTFLSTIFLPTLVIFLTLRFRSKPSSKPSSVGDDIKRTSAIANFTAFHAKSLNVRLRLRAGPNVRLTTAFGIRNSFTTTDDAEHLEFLRRAVQVIKSADGAAWRRVWTLANGRMDSLAPRDHGLRLNIERIARVLCFDAVLELLFPQTRVRPLDVGGADRATKLVNVLWLESKRDPAGTEASTARAYALESLYEAMRGLVSEPEEEALGLIMPAYETLWRVVLLTYVHVAFRYVDSETLDLVREVVEVVSRNGGCRGARSQLHLNVDNFARVSGSSVTPPRSYHTDDGSRCRKLCDCTRRPSASTAPRTRSRSRLTSSPCTTTRESGGQTRWSFDRAALQH